MISTKMEKLLNEQFLREIYSAHQYLAICSYFEGQELDGFANFYRIQAQEELSHAMKQFDYLHLVDGKIEMQQVPKPTTQFNSINHAVQLTLDHEREVTKSINSILKEAVNENDFATQTFLQWFVTEQVEEEALVHNLLRKLDRIGDNASALFMLNSELANRKPDVAAGGANGI